MPNAFLPSASLLAIKQRADLLGQIRHYFAKQNVLEVDVPALGQFSVTDVHLAALAVNIAGQAHYLQTSPEFYMKRLLAAGTGSIYSLAKAYRADESGRKHRPEFTMLEWYRLHFDDVQLMADVTALLAAVGVAERVEQIAYSDLFLRVTGLHPHTASTEQLADYCAQHFDASWPNTPRSTWLDLMFSQLVEPTLQAPTLVFDFPECQCALAKVAMSAEGHAVAKRFELYWRGVELANGYWELTCVHTLQQRFNQDNQIRREQGLPEVAQDPYFIAAMAHGLPECAGIALGVDRLFMCLLNEHDIAAVMPFGLG